MSHHGSHTPPDNPRVAQGLWKGKPARFRRDRLIVSIRPGRPVSDALDAVVSAASESLQSQPSIVNRQGRSWAILTFPPHPQAETALPALAMRLSQRPDVRYAEPDFEGRGHFDPEYENQAWAGTVDLEGAWTVTHGDNNVLVAVLDSGISISPGKTDPDHVELNGPRFIVRHTIGGTGVYHDYVASDDVPGDEHGHGTHITGIIAAAANNGAGIAGINWVSPVYVARVLDQYNLTYASWVKLAMEDLIAYAADAGYARVVVNLSLGFLNESDSMHEMCNEANTGQFLICCGPGLDGTYIALDYPAAHSAVFDHVIAIGNVYQGVIQGPYVDDYSILTVFAPGTEIVSVAPDYKVALWDPLSKQFAPYPKLSGTSQAAAIVSGIASLAWSANLKLSPGQLRDCLVHTADAFSKGTDAGKSVNAGAFVNGAVWMLSLDSPRLEFLGVVEGTTRRETLVFAIESCTELNIEVVRGSDTGMPASFAITSSSARFDPAAGSTRLDGIEVEYTGTVAGDVADGEFKVRCVESEDEWTVYLTASTVAA